MRDSKFGRFPSSQLICQKYQIQQQKQMKREYQNVVENALKLYQAFKPHKPIKDLVKQSDLVGSIQQLPIPQHHTPRSNLIGLRKIRLTIYNLPPQSLMKLHNHPYMNVITYIMDGKMSAKIYNPISISTQFQRLKQLAPIQKILKAHKQNRVYTQKQQMLEKGQLELIEGQRKIELNNLHEFETDSENSCTFLDIIFPDYNQTTRVYHTFNSNLIFPDPQLYILSKCQDPSQMCYI